MDPGAIARGAWAKLDAGDVEGAELERTKLLCLIRAAEFDCAAIWSEAARLRSLRNAHARRRA